ncbi:MAG: ATP-binding protein [Gemmatimonadota bacterium]|nr:ATP-binding protein [Gemmatimonadota bacterium]
MPLPTDRDIVLELPSDIRSIERVVEYVVLRCRDCRAKAHKLDLNFRVALTEALSNAMMYGNGHDPDKSVKVEITLGHGQLEARVTDQGRGFDPGSVPDPTEPANLSKPCGRGLFLMRELLDEVWFNDRGNQVTLVLRFDSGDALEGGVQA